MRVLIEVVFDTETTNKLIADNEMPRLMESVLGTLKPEAAYFLARDGRRSALIFADLADEASIVTSIEPFWLNGRASVTVTPCMTADDLGTGLGRLRAS